MWLQWIMRVDDKLKTSGIIGNANISGLFFGIMMMIFNINCWTFRMWTTLYYTPWFMMVDQEDSNKLVCPDCQFTTHKERKLVKHVKKTHKKDALKCPFCVTNVHYSSDTSALSSHKRHEHRQVRLNCFLCEFSSKSMRKWTSHLTKSHGKQSRHLADLGSKQRNHSSAFRDKNNNINSKIQTEICEKKSECKKRKYSKKRKSLCSEDSYNYIDLTSDRKNEFSGKKSSDKIIKQISQPFDNNAVIDVSSEESSNNKRINKVDSSKVDKRKTSLKRSELKSVDVPPSLSDAEMMYLFSGDGHGESMDEESLKKESGDSGILDSYLDMARNTMPNTVQKDSDKPSVGLDKTINNLKKKFSESEDQFACPYCNRCFSSSIVRTQHFKTRHTNFVTSDSKYACKCCSYNCEWISSLIIHIRSHSSEKPFACEICHRQFKSKKYLVVHLRTHSNAKPFKCHLCSYKSNYNHNLLRHIRFHTDTRPHKCSMCGYAAYTKSSLTDHIRTHTGEKPFECHHCHMVFRRSTIRNKHLKERACY